MNKITTEDIDDFYAHLMRSAGSVTSRWRQLWRSGGATSTRRPMVTDVDGSVDAVGSGGEPFRWTTGIEDTFIGQEEPGRRRLDEYELLQHYRQWREDVDLAADTGFDSIRYGIPWYLVEPEPGRFDWSFPDRVLPYLVERDLDPMVDLVHYGTPLWMPDAFLDPTYPERVAAYAGAVAQRYAGLVRMYTPLNEPSVAADLCGRVGRWPPYATGNEGFLRVAMAISAGIVRSVVAIRAVDPEALIVHVEACGIGSTADPTLEDGLSADLARQDLSVDLVTGRVGDGHPLAGELAEAGVSGTELAWFRRHAVAIDVLGLNYYPFMSVWRRSLGSGGGVLQEAVWGGGEHLALAVRAAHARSGVPVWITECSHNERALPGSAFGSPPYAGGAEGAARAAWLDEAVAAVAGLRAGGVPVVGFTWWPLYDLVNWEYREGNDPVERYLEPMGLYGLRAEPDGALRRVRLPCAERMREVILRGPPRREPPTTVPAGA